MKRWLLFIILAAFAISSCGGNPHDIDVKRDMEYMYSVMEHCIVTVAEGVRQKRINQSLDEIDRYLKKEENNIKMVGVRLDSIILKEEEAMHIIRYNERYNTLAQKYLDYIDANMNSEQRNRFVDMLAGRAAKDMMDQLMTPKSSIDFFKKAIR